MAQPFLYEIPTRPWLWELARAQRAPLDAPLDLAAVPDEVLDGFVERGVTHLWLMGLWPTGPRSRAEAVRHPDLRRAYAEALPDLTDDDIIGSPYAVADAHTAPEIGGDAALARLRARLHARGLAVIGDFVPNHTALDHPWVRAHPQRFVHAAKEIPEAVAASMGKRDLWLLHGKDPWFPGWTDTVQLDYRRKETRDAMRAWLLSIAQRTDGVRCDMAMLVLDDVFARTWAHVPCDRHDAALEFWSDAIAAVKAQHPGFLFLAEAYWDLEPRLLELGFDFTYDKKLTDLLVHDRCWDVQAHLLGLGQERVARSAHFLENHDEARVAAHLGPDAHRAAAAVVLGIPGMRFLHDGQLEGRQTFARIQLRRRRVEPIDVVVQAMYTRLLRALGDSVVGRGEGHVLEPRPAWHDNPTHRCFVIAQWQAADDDRFDLVVVNLAPARSQCFVPLHVRGLAGGSWALRDRLSDERHTREGDELATRGLYLDVAGRGTQLFAFERVRR